MVREFPLTRPAMESGVVKLGESARLLAPALTMVPAVIAWPEGVRVTSTDPVKSVRRGMNSVKYSMTPLNLARTALGWAKARPTQRSA
jgi:hypothetical protein